MREVHGMKHTTEYTSWQGMKDRCYRENSKEYSRYGGRGITVCDSWRDSFLQFYKDMGLKPTKKHSLDRIDNGGNYEPSNCKWSTCKEQSNNRRIRNDNKTGITGVNKASRYNGWEVYFMGSYLGSSPDFFEACCIRKSAEYAGVC